MDDMSPQNNAESAGNSQAGTVFDRARASASGVDKAAASLRHTLVEHLREYATEAERDPLSNPVQRLAGDLMLSILKDRTVTEDELAALVRLLTTEAFIGRAERMRNYLGELDELANRESIRNSIKRLISLPDGSVRPARDAMRLVERASFGIVMTAHPTFVMPPDLAGAMAALVGHTGAPTEPALDQIVRTAFESVHGYTGGIALTEEHEQSLAAIMRLQSVLCLAWETAFDVFEEAYPDAWRTFTPRLATVASWVGYDLDGRSDIRWTDTFRARLKVQKIQLERYLETARGLIGSPGELSNGQTEPSSSLKTTLKLIESRLTYGLRTVNDDLSRLPEDAHDAEAVQTFNKALHETLGDRLVDAAELTELLSEAASSADADTAKALLVFRTELSAFGLGAAHTHVRLNATQLINAIRGDLGDALPAGDEEQERRSGRRQRAQAVDALLAQAQPVTVNFGSILAERTSAKRLFMLVAQMLKYIDRSAPVRFLIAECEEASTVLSALYFAKLFGIEQHLDISPLFETHSALRRGDEMIADLLDNPHYLAYVRLRGRLCIQTGFSDAGRYLGQSAASLAIERLRIKVGQLMAARGLTDIELVVFDTHGESIGRGAHPTSFRHRIDHLFPAVNRELFARLGLSVKQEVSFQGGDGYLFFQTEKLALATLARLIEVGMTAGPADQPAMRPATSLNDEPEAIRSEVRLADFSDDAFYLDTEYSLDFFIAAASFNEQQVADNDYGALLHLFGANLLYPTGSRTVRRQHEKSGFGDHLSASQMRAIPHNGVLQQMGYMANSCGGLGTAINRDAERFAEIYDGSPRCRALMQLAREAFARSDLYAFGAYVSLCDPQYWMRLSMHPSPLEQSFSHLSRFFQSTGQSERVHKAHQGLMQDALILRRFLKVSAVRHLGSGSEPMVDREALALTHAVRLALIQVIFVMATRIPRFTSQPDVTMENVREALLGLDVPTALEALQRAFPVRAEADLEADFGEAASYRSDSQRGYDAEHDTLFRPIADAYGHVRDLSSAITHLIGAVG